MRALPVALRAPLLLAAAVALGGLAAAPATAQTSALPFQCQATPPIGSAQTFALSASANATAPATVTTGQAFSVTIAPGALTVPSSVNGNTINSISGITLSMPVPANASLSGVSLSGGSGLGSGAPSTSVSGGTISLKVPGPIAGGSAFTLPTITLKLTAGAAGGTVSTHLAGSSYSSPGLTFTATVPELFFTVSVPTACYPSPSPVLSTTSITS
ncbi:cyclodehydratase [Kitasatospora acidiphila]|uniref:Cyclodehydratase n=1 Tax=Kitasatospora acidiphila TaxID=2567942 RepID=A0A540WG90_9ACTN|nr:cyclodehydratase [Kitasatospora acidiphila]TQF08035.1 cyclodehydratase [Kitasatospora acidiphila]